MVKYSEKLDVTFAALADPTRRAILARLARGDRSVGELAEPFAVSLPAVSKHLRVLERAGLLTQDREGRVRRCRLRAGSMRSASEWIDRYRRYWSRQLDALAEYVEGAEAGEKQTRTGRSRKREKRR